MSGKIFPDVQNHAVAGQYTNTNHNVKDMKKYKTYGVQTVFMTRRELTEHLQRLDERFKRQPMENTPNTGAPAYVHKHARGDKAPQ